jgi:hypothetical protein
MNERPRIAPSSWREPYDVLSRFARSQTTEEAEVLLPKVVGACRELKHRGFYLKQQPIGAGGVQPTLRGNEGHDLQCALATLSAELRNSPLLGGAPHPRLLEARDRIVKMIDGLSLHAGAKPSKRRY